MLSKMGLQLSKIFTKLPCLMFSIKLDLKKLLANFLYCVISVDKTEWSDVWCNSEFHI